MSTLISVGLAVVFGVLAGSSAVVVFNRMPAGWLCDYGEEPEGELKQKDVPRIKSYPWKMAFSMLFVLSAVKMAAFDLQYAAAAIVSMWALLIIAIADQKYMIIPDQFVVLLAITAFSYVPYHASFLSPLWGALIGGGCMLVIGVIGKLLFKKEALGFGDVKLFAAVGLITGPFGVSVILMASSFLSCFVFGISLLRKKVKRTDVLALGPYIAFSAAVYLVFA
ncbi:MAG: A24 family peptidase [Clostridiales bacterium]|nr:A24 family peptidase [Clostridiales bacterium]